MGSGVTRGKPGEVNLAEVGSPANTQDKTWEMTGADVFTKTLPKSPENTPKNAKNNLLKTKI